MRRTLLTVMAAGFILAMSSIGCVRDNTAVIKDKLSKAEKLKENGNEQEAMEALLDAANRIDDDTPLNV
ncbi:MAG: hypothetical protein HDS37_07470, partial [Bacteroides sp.]|nr:hypothetical protein [Bacteroides sp.]